MKKLMLFMLAAMLGIVAANAQITQGRIGTGDITIAGYTTTDVYGLDFDNDGTNLEFRIADFPGSPNLTNGYLTYDWTDGGNNIVNETGVWDYMAILASGVTVGSTSEFEGQGDGAFNTTNLTAGVHYMGFRILLSDGVHYGWAEYTVAENGDDFDLTWTKCYYNATVGEAIATGDEGGSSCDVAAGDLPYSFGFETLDCWEQQQINGSVSWSATTSRYSVIQGTKYAFISSTTNGYQTRLISPTFNVDGVPNLTLKFAHAHEVWVSDQDSLKVEYRLSPTSEWQTLATYKNSVTAFEFASIPLPETSSTLQIAFHAYLEYGRGIAIDSLTLVSVSCQAPAISDITATDNTATVTWSGSASQYGITLDDGDEEVVNGTSKTFTGLTANTSYSISLRAICGGEGSEVVSQTFRTLCGTEAFPYSENFESYTAGTGNFPECWTSVSGTNYVQSGSSYASQGTKALHMQGIGSTVVTPIINIGGNDAFISFDLKCEDVDKSGDMAIGVAASPASAESAEWLDTIDAATTYDRYEYIYHNTSSLASGCIVFKQMNTTYSNYYYWIDSLTVTEPPACAKPINLTLNEATNNSLTLSWTENGSASTWVVKVGDGAWTEVRDNPYEITGLTANTDYVVSVRAFCDPDTSDAVSGTFRTLCDAEDFPYSENFESFTASNVPDCWTNIAGSTTVVENGYTTYAYEGTKALRISGGGAIATPVINVGGSDVYVNFELKRSSTYAGTLAVGIAASPSLVDAAVYFDTIEPDNTNYNNYEYIFHNTLSLTSGCLIFKQLGSTSTYYYFYIDSLTVSEPPACAKPINLALDEATENSLTLSWTENGSATKWVVKVDDGEWATVTENPYTLTGLTANTEYAITVRAFCDPDTSDAVSGTFRTACATEVVTTDDSFEEEFEGITSGIPTCWARTATAWKSYATGNTGRGLYFTDYYGHVDTLITPEFNLSALTNGAQLRFWYKIPEEEDWYGDALSATLQVLYRTSTDGEWTVGETLTETVEDWTEHEFVLPASTAAASYQIAFRAVSANDYTDTYVYLDGVVVETVPNCPRPTSGDITDVTPESAVVTWDAVASATGYSVAYSETNDVDDATVVSVNDTTKTLEGLDAETTYYVWVRTVCGSDNANWLSLGSFTTEVACAEVTGLSMTEATTSSITIGWTIDGSTGYESTAVLVSYKEADASDWTETVATGNSFTLENLGEGETYNFRVRNVCGNDTANYATLTASSKVCGEVADASTTLNYVPTYPYYKYSYTQSIYTDAEVGDIDTISGISFKYSTSLARTVDVYIADVANASFDGGWIDISNFTQVATNYAWNLTTDWSEIVFETPFVHQPGNDIVIAIDDNTGNDNGTYSYNFKAHTGKSYYVYSDNTDYTPASPASGTQILKSPDIRFTVNCGGSVQPQTCDVPTGLAANNVTANSAVISWTGTAAQYEVELNGQSSTVNTNSYTAQGLTAATAYAVRVRALCDGGLTSDWTAMVNFITLDNGGVNPEPCGVPTNVAVSNVTTNSAVVTWEAPVESETFEGEWNLVMGQNDSVHTTITLNQTLHTILGMLGQDIADVDENVSVAGTQVPVTIEQGAGNQMNISGNFDMMMYGVDEPVTFHFNTTGTVTENGMNIETANISESVAIMGTMNIDYTGTVTFEQPTELPEDGVLTIGIASMNITGYGDTVIMGQTGTVNISMTASDIEAAGMRAGAGNSEPTYEVMITNTASGVENTYASATRTYSAEGLTAATAYTAKVRTVCGEGNYSEWSTAVPFTTLNGDTPVECDVPTNVATSNVTATSVTVSWTGTASEYQIEVSDGGATPITITVSASPYTVEGLTAATNYTVRVRALCEDDETSDWSASASFTTLDGGEPGPQGIDDVNASYSVSVYPNPATNNVTVSVDGLTGKAQVSVVDMSGRTVMTSTMESDATQLNVSKLAQGTYFVRIEGENISTVRKLVVK